ncbi:MAG: PepSY-associated TM helix domain-containing protein [Pseudomonadota bacterium]
METLRQSMSWAHTWTGLLFGWVLYFMFVTGSAGYYDAELDRWMEPERAPSIEYEDPVPLMQVGLEHALEKVPTAEEITVRLPYERSYSPYLRIFVEGDLPNGEHVHESYELLANGSPPPETRDTTGGQTLYRMHWAFHYIPSALGELIAGFATIFMFAAIISGIITHKKIFVDFFTLRLGKGQRSWLDSHNVISVMTLPFQIMITISGFLFVITTFFVPIFIAQYGWSSETVRTVEREMFDRVPGIERSGEMAEPIALEQLLETFEEEFPSETPYAVTVTNPGDATSTIQLNGRTPDGIVRMSPYIEFNAVSGEIIKMQKRGVTNSLGVINTMEGLHEGLFAGPLVRILFFVSGLMGAGMIATGLVLWTKKRRQKLRDNERAERNLMIIERMNVGMIAGLPIAISAFFYANRLLPVGMESRADWELHTIFITWLVLLVLGLVRPTRKAWIEQLSLASIAFILLPVINAVTTSLHLGNTLPLPGREGDLMMAGVDLWFLTIGLGFALAARIAARKPEMNLKRKGQAASAPVAAE